MWQRLVAVQAIIIVVLSGACGGQDKSPRSQPSGASQKAAGKGSPGNSGAPAHDPPLRFAPEPITVTEQSGATTAVTPNGLYLLGGGRDEPRLSAVDLASGKPRWSGPLPGTRSNQQWAQPAIATVDGGNVVVAAFRVLQEGAGTATGRKLARVYAVDAATGRPRWTRDFDVQDKPERENGRIRKVVAEGGYVAVTSVGPNYPRTTDQTTYVLDARDGRPLWQRAGLEAEKFDKDVLIGRTRSSAGLGTESTAVGLSGADGTGRWSVEGIGDQELDPLGPGLVSFVSRAEGSGGSEKTLITSTQTGKPLATINRNFRCFDDELSTVICDRDTVLPSDVKVVAFDRSSGKKLWELRREGGGRVAPEIETARRGAVYATVSGSGGGDGQGVILDARTGQDKVTGLKEIPGEIIPGYGVRTGNTIEIYPAIG